MSAYQPVVPIQLSAAAGRAMIRARQLEIEPGTPMCVMVLWPAEVRALHDALEARAPTAETRTLIRELALVLSAFNETDEEEEQ